MTNHCFICGATVEDGSSLCSDACESRAIDRQKWAGKEPCEDCLDRNAKDSGYDVEPALDGEDVCEEHRDQRNDAAYESHLQDFYGGSR